MQKVLAGFQWKTGIQTILLCGKNDRVEGNGFLETLFNQNSLHFHINNLMLSKTSSLKQKV